MEKPRVIFFAFFFFFVYLVTIYMRRVFIDMVFFLLGQSASLL
jgi:hypothetical protein